MNKLVGTLLLLCVVVLVALALLSGLAVYSGGQKMALLTRPPAHGTSFLITPDLSQAHGDTNTLASLKEVINRRFNKYGSKIFWKAMPGERVLILTPTTTNRELAAVASLISRGGHLEFRMVHENSDQIVKSGQNVPVDYELLTHSENGQSNQPVFERIVAKKQPEPGLAGKIVQSATVAGDAMGQPMIEFQLNPDNAAAFAEMTRTNIHHRLAIVIDGQLYSAPVVNSEIKSGAGMIIGSFSFNEARTLADLIEHPLPVAVTVLETKTF